MNLFYSTWLIILFFILGIYVTMSYSTEDLTKEYNNTCPNILYQVGSEIWLYNSNNPQLDGINPIKFKNMEDYHDFVNWQKQFNLNCPILYVQRIFNCQGEAEYQILNTPLVPFREEKIIIESFKKKTPKAFDPYDQEEGVEDKPIITPNYVGGVLSNSVSTTTTV